MIFLKIFQDFLGFFNFSTIPPAPPPLYGREGGLTNERPGSGHVIWGSMRGLEKKTAPDGADRHTDTQTEGHGNSMTNSAQRGQVGENVVKKSYSRFYDLLVLQSTQLKCFSSLINERFQWETNRNIIVGLYVYFNSLLFRYIVSLNTNNNRP